MATESSATRLLRQARERPDEPAYFVRNRDRWVGTSWGEYALQARRVARALLALGLRRQEATCILGFNRPEWTLFDLGTTLAGGVPVGIYTTSAAPEVSYLVRHSGARIVLVENVDQWQKLRDEKPNLPHLEHVILMRGSETPRDPKALSWEAFLTKGEQIREEDLDLRLSEARGNDLATLIYTSGTTGPPKAVMLSHRSLAWTADTALAQLFSIGAGDCLLSYLPLSHIAEKMFSLHGSVAAGYAVYFARSPETVAEDLREVQPTIIFGVPRVWEKLHEGVRGRLAAVSGPRLALIRWAMEIGRRAAAFRCRGENLPWTLALRYRVARRLVFSRVKPLLGLGRARLCASGAAPISREVLEFFSGLDVLIHEIYGQSEDCGPTTFNQPGATRLGTVGPPIPGVEVRIAEDGEVLVRGPNVFQGYYRDPAATAETLVNGWLHSGDLGTLDSDGFLTITGRKKELLITSGGKNISPNNIEAALKDHDLICEAMVIGDRRKYLTALIVVDVEGARQELGNNIEGKASLRQGKELQAAVQKIVEGVNAKLARVQSVRKFRLLEAPFSVEAGELTPTLKLKRRVVEEKHSALIEAMYQDD